MTSPRWPNSHSRLAPGALGVVQPTFVAYARADEAAVNSIAPPQAHLVPGFRQVGRGRMAAVAAAQDGDLHGLSPRWL